MRAIVLEKRGDTDVLIAKTVPKPGKPEGQDLLVK